MDLRQMRYFVAIAEQSNFTHAAARLNIAQPALSVQIRRLEEEIGAQLLIREARGVKLTRAGSFFLGRARETLTQIEQSVELTRRAANGDIGSLAIGYSAPAEFRVFPRIVPAFKKLRPGVHMSFHGMSPRRQVEALRQERLDIGFAWLPLPFDEFDIVELANETLVAAIPSEHRLAIAPTVSIRDLSVEPLILFSRSLDPDTYHQIEQLFLRCDTVLNVAFELDTMMSAINFVAMGAGCSLIADYACAVKREGVVYRPISGPNIAKTLAIIKRKRSEEVIDSFFRFAVDNLARRGPQKLPPIGSPLP